MWREAVTELAQALAAQTGRPVDELAGWIERPQRLELGDLALPCFRLSAALRQPPPAIAQRLAEGFRPTERVREAKATGPFLNFRVDRALRAREVLERLDREGPRWGGSNAGTGKTIVIDYSSPNIAKPFGIGHLRSTVIGAALYRVFKHLGHPVVGINHLGDWGTQFGLMAVGLEREGPPPPGVDPVRHFFQVYVRTSKAAQDDPAVREAARAWFSALERGDADRRAAWSRIKEQSLQEFRRIYALFDVDFDSWDGEAFFNDRLAAVIARAQELGIAEVDQGALVVRLDGRDKPALLRKSDGATLYITRDLAAALYRHERYGFHRCLYVVGAPQRDHFIELQGVLKRMGCGWADDVVHVPFGHYQGMKTREGTVVFLEDVLDEARQHSREIMRAQGQTDEAIASAVGVAAVVFNDLARARIKDVSFDLEAIVRFDGETGPYLQYTHARLRSIEQKVGPAGQGAVDHAVFGDDQVFPLIEQLADFPEVVTRVARDYEPSLLAAYLIELAQGWNGIEKDFRVKDAPPALRPARLLLVQAIRHTLALGLGLLGIKALEHM